MLDVRYLSPKPHLAYALIIPLVYASVSVELSDDSFAAYFVSEANKIRSKKDCLEALPSRSPSVEFASRMTNIATRNTL